MKVSFIKSDYTKRTEHYKNYGVAAKKSIKKFLEEHKLNTVIVYPEGCIPQVFSAIDIDMF